jgi:CRISPR/Cas system Type II protein with McrA/HNH and RuvC-like nuclease domain
VFVTLRTDTFRAIHETRVSVLKVFVSEEEAKNEVNRLNNLAKTREFVLEKLEKNFITSIYSYQIGRIKKGILPS